MNNDKLNCYVRTYIRICVFQANGGMYPSGPWFKVISHILYVHARVLSSGVCGGEGGEGSFYSKKKTPTVVQITIEKALLECQNKL